MLVTCWSVKGGSGTTVVASALAVLLSRRTADGVLLVDAGGDVPTVLGIPEPSSPGIHDWFATAERDEAALHRLELAVGPGLSLLPAGSIDPSAGNGDDSRSDHLLAALEGRSVVIDAGPPSALSLEVAAASVVSLLVIRPCYLALRRALAAPVRPSAVVLVEEAKRSLDVADVEDVLGVPVCSIVPWEAAIARSVDAGLLGARLPGSLASALRSAA